MIYGTGGAAWAKFDGSITANCRLAGCGASLVSQNPTTNFSDRKLGWTAGAGIEAMLDCDWIARAEYPHYDLGSITSTLPAVESSTTWSRAFRYETVRVGLSYKFGGPVSTGY
jgi:outer membrane immunogenic protein